jgi:hypothetical protein
MTYVLRMNFAEQKRGGYRPVAFLAGADADELRFIRNAGGHASRGLQRNVAALRIFCGVDRGVTLQVIMNLLVWDQPFLTLKYFMQNQFYEIKFDFTTSLSKESAVLAMLGWIKKPFREVSEAEYEQQYKSEVEEFIEPSLFEVLREIKDSADSEYVEAKYEESLDEEALAEKLANIKKAHELIETAHRFYCGIDDELAKGERSELRLDRCATKNPEDPYITLISLAKWASKEYKIELFPSSGQVTFKDLGLVQQEIIESLEDHSEDTTHLQITFALLVEAFSKTANTFHHDNGNPNVSTIVGEILQIENIKELHGQCASSIDKCIKDAIKAKQNFSGSMSNTKLRNFKITFGLLVETFAKKGASFQDANEPNVAKIAEHLAEHARELPEQDKKTIETRILDALEVKNHKNSKKD